MNWDISPKKAVSLAYISKNSDEDGIAIAEAMCKTMRIVMDDLKKQGVLFYVPDMHGAKIMCKAVVKAAAALDYEHGQQVMLNGKSITSYPPLIDENGEPLHNAMASIYNGTESLTVFAGRTIKEDGTVNLTSIRWGLYNAKNPKESMSVKGIEEIMQSQASQELKKIAQALEWSGYIRDYDVAYNRAKIDNNDLAYAMKKTVKPIIKILKEGNAMPILISQSGKEYLGAAFIEVQQDKTRTDKYYVRAGIRKNDETIYIHAGSQKAADGTLPLYSISYQKYNTDWPAESLRVAQDDIKSSDDISAEMKHTAAAIIDMGVLQLYTELREYSFKLNTEYFREKVSISQKREDGTYEYIEKKQCYASYTPQGQYPEQLTIFNRTNPEVLVTMLDHDKYGHSVRVTNTELTEDENGLHRKSSEHEKSATGYIQDKFDVVRYCPPLEEIYHAVADWLGLDYLEIVSESRITVESLEGYESIESLGEDDIPY